MKSKTQKKLRNIFERPNPKWLAPHTMHLRFDGVPVDIVRYINLLTYLLTSLKDSAGLDM